MYFRLENTGRIFQIDLEALSALRPNVLKEFLEKNMDEHFDDDICHRVISDSKLQLKY